MSATKLFPDSYRLSEAAQPIWDRRQLGPFAVAGLSCASGPLTLVVNVRGRGVVKQPQRHGREYVDVVVILALQDDDSLEHRTDDHVEQVLRINLCGDVAALACATESFAEFGSDGGPDITHHVLVSWQIGEQSGKSCAVGGFRKHRRGLPDERANVVGQISSVRNSIDVIGQRRVEDQVGLGWPAPVERRPCHTACLSDHFKAEFVVADIGKQSPRDRCNTGVETGITRPPGRRPPAVVIEGVAAEFRAHHLQPLPIVSAVIVADKSTTGRKKRRLDPTPRTSFFTIRIVKSWNTS